MDRLTKRLFMGLIIGLVIGTAGGYFLDSLVQGRSSHYSARGNFQMSEQMQKEVAGVFDGNSSGEIEAYCQNHVMQCAYYCRNINPANGQCKSIANYTGGRMQWNR